jgi:hypothetical protein
MEGDAQQGRKLVADAGSFQRFGPWRHLSIEQADVAAATKTA